MFKGVWSYVFFSRDCANRRVGGWVSFYLLVVQIEKVTIQINRRPLSELKMAGVGEKSKN